MPSKRSDRSVDRRAAVLPLPAYAVVLVDQRERVLSVVSPRKSRLEKRQLLQTHRVYWVTISVSGLAQRDQLFQRYRRNTTPAACIPALRAMPSTLSATSRLPEAWIFLGRVLNSGFLFERVLQLDIETWSGSVWSDTVPRGETSCRARAQHLSSGGPRAERAKVMIWATCSQPSVPSSPRRGRSRVWKSNDVGMLMRSGLRKRSQS